MGGREMSDANYQMLVEIGGIMDGAVPREGICTTADGVRWLCDRVQELKNELYETKRERDEAQRELEMWKFERDEALEHAARYRLEANKLIMMGIELREQNAKLRDIAERAIEEMESGDPVGTADAYRAELDQLKEGAK
jgi:predicted nuclease with TOPRIM domain